LRVIEIICQLFRGCAQARKASSHKAPSSRVSNWSLWR